MNKKNRKRGVTLVEVMVAIMIFVIVMVGGFVFFFYGRVHIAHSNHKRMALELTKERIEMWKADDYSEIEDKVENDTELLLGGIQFTRNTSFPTPALNYKEVTVTTSWVERGTTYKVPLVTIIAQ